ncbi:MFS transporter [Acetivibrio ethanolgignens]|uniref:Major facilitator superfamily (MFS) profile domain-containing protein n=1 Tax=Acetivibrio ethanolgignens TaxID=290052 RepID=A0A0V8QHL0_9FIRM|nr:MFS transporter [Acetivibrio ethanolgignens]KSV60077.1 hypothetical protein ASU35_06630 [Acetivibrio ethanolgignens]
MNHNRLWTKNFTIITLGTVVSMLGNAVSGFAISLLVLDYTESTFLYALFMVVYNLPKIITPILAGPYVDRFSRKRVVYILDFLSSGIYLIMFWVLGQGFFHYGVFLLVCLLVGSIDGIYTVAYDSLYPNLVSEGNFSKAYSISSMIYPLAAFMVPVASFAYSYFGTAAPLFLFNAVTFFIAAVFETQIDYKEKHIKNEYQHFDAASYRRDFREGLQYLLAEKGLFIITVYFCITIFSGGAIETLILPFFKNHPQYFHTAVDVVTLYTIVTGCGVIGRLAGGMIHYRFKYPADKKFMIALTVYTTISFLDIFRLYLPINLMMLTYFITGIMGVTSYNIRISATQSYIPDDKRGRFNGIFNMACTCGSIVGQLLAGALGDFFPERRIIIGFALINLAAVWLVMYQGREAVKKIYNRSV